VEGADDRSLNRSNSSNDGDEDQLYCPIDPKSAVRKDDFCLLYKLMLSNSMILIRRENLSRS
jgi:hypothetical protein